MAKIQFSAVVGDARGKTGGNVFTKGRYGAVLRRKVSPVQPRSAAVMEIRALFTALSKLWASEEMNDKRQAWEALAAVNQRTNVFGNSYTLTGLQLFQSCNRNLQLLGLDPILDAPNILTVEALVSLQVSASAASHAILSEVEVLGEIANYTYASYTGVEPAVDMEVTIAGFTTPGNNVTGIIISASGGANGTFSLGLTTQANETHAGTSDATTLAVTFEPATVPDDTAFAFDGSPGVGLGREFVGSRYKFLTFADEAEAAPFNLAAEYAELYGAPRSGTKISVRGWAINKLTGAASIESVADCVVA